ncbi:hypothetical protein PFISCL1PPCAC_20100, partial [Pristionchus fissidentatus]
NVGHQLLTMLAGITIFLGAFLYNFYSLRQLSLHKSTRQYSVARSFQIRENVRIFKLIINAFSKAGGVSTAGFAMFGFYLYGPPEWNFYRFVSAALFDLFMILFCLLFMFLAIQLDTIFQKEFNNIGVIVMTRK